MAAKKKAKKKTARKKPVKKKTRSKAKQTPTYTGPNVFTVAGKKVKVIRKKKTADSKWLKICFFVEIPEPGENPLIIYDAAPIPIDRCMPSQVNQLCHCDASTQNVEKLYALYSKKGKKISKKKKR